VSENSVPKKIFRHRRYDEKEGENYNMRSLKKDEVSEACDMLAGQSKYIIFPANSSRRCCLQ
jgi:hypothetical protein